MLHKPTKLLCLDLAFMFLDEDFDRTDVAFEQVHCVSLNLVFARSTILLAEEPTLGTMNFQKFITVDIV